ncbi:YheC/YheD family protein [Neobacillus thermocopriae]|nr:YheC/YheD family protein [Neobacillus thermocopriae]
MSFPFIPLIMTVRKSPDKQDCLIQMSHHLYNQLQINQCNNIYMKLGRTTIKANIQIIEMVSNEIILPENMFHHFRLPINRYKLKAKYCTAENTILLGPVIGLLTDFHVKENEEPFFRSIHRFCEELHYIVKDHGGFFYVFSYESFDSKGYYFSEGKWHPASLPLPDVVYNRVHSRKLEQKESFKKFRNELENLSIPIFNDRFLSKWEVFEQIKNENKLLDSIPDTKLFSKENLLEFAQKYETVFIKPIHGSQGKNIIKLTKERDDLFSIQTSISPPPANSRQIFTLDQLYQQIKSLQQNRICIVQQGIHFLPYQSRPLDFRVLVHKDLKHRWKITSIVARVGAEDEFVSNMARGGITMRPHVVFQESMTRKKSMETIKKIKKLAIETAEGISKNTSGITGELGIDIGVDKEGNPWIIEVNSKPSKLFHDDGKIRPSAKAIIQFSTILAFESI